LGGIDEILVHPDANNLVHVADLVVNKPDAYQVAKMLLLRRQVLAFGRREKLARPFRLQFMCPMIEAISISPPICASIV
jgi:hypothetical protein